MRIAIFSNAYKPVVSGVVTSIALFRQGLIDAGHNVYVIAPEYKDYEDEEPYIFRFPALNLPERIDFSLAISFKASMAPTVRGIKPALIHSQHPVWMGDLATAFARDLNLPLVFTFHSHYDEFAQRYVPIAPELAGIVTDEIVKRYLEKCAHVVAPTPSTRDFILQSYGVDVPVTIVPTPVDLSLYHDLAPERIRAALGLENVEVLLYVGRLAKEKSLDFLLRAFARIVTQRGNSTIETQGLVLVEAMAAGTPVVAVEAPGSVDVLAEGGGLLVPAQERAFAEAVLALLADEMRRRAMGAQAARAAQRYTISATTARLLTVYQAAIAAGPRDRKQGVFDRLVDW